MPVVAVAVVVNSDLLEEFDYQSATEYLKEKYSNI